MRAREEHASVGLVERRILSLCMLAATFAVATPASAQEWTPPMQTPNNVERDVVRGPQKGAIGLPSRAGGYPVFVDGHAVTPSLGALVVDCGPHVVKIGHDGREQPIDVPCGGRADIAGPAPVRAVPTWMAAWESDPAGVAPGTEPVRVNEGTPLAPLVPNESGPPFTLTTQPRESSVRFFLTLDGGVDWFRRLPSLSFASDPEQLPGRDVAARPLPRTPNALLWQGSLSVGLRIGDHWVVPVVGMSLGLGMLGWNPKLVTSSDGSMVSVLPRVTQVTFLLPGIGRRWTQRRWDFSASVRTLAMYTAMPATVASGGTTTDITVDAWSLGIRGELDACRRLDPANRLCLVVAPHLYESGFLNGGSAGLRWEIGR